METEEVEPFAIEYAQRGWSVFPIHNVHSGVCTCRRGKGCPTPGKHPRTRHGVKDATREAKTIKRWWKQWPNANIGIAAGAVSGLVVIDVDAKNGGQATLQGLQQQLGSLPAGPVVRSGGGGFHLYFGHPGGKVPNPIGRANGVDVKGDGGYVVAPPSVHLSGGSYSWQVPPKRYAPPELPAKWLEWIRNGRCYTGDSPQDVTQGTHGYTGISGLHRGSQDIALGFAANCKPPNNEETIEKLIHDCLPPHPGQRHKCLFKLARGLKGIPELAEQPVTVIEPYIKRWHELALPQLRTQSYEDSWWDFAESWESVKYPLGAGLMSDVISRASTADMPAVAERYENPKVRLLIAVCRGLQQEQGDDPFFLSVRSVAEIGEITPIQASRWLRGLVRDGVLERVSKGDYATHQASQYRYIGGD